MATSPAAVSDFALQQLWLEQHTQHATLQKQFFPKEDVITSLLVTPATVSNPCSSASKEPPYLSPLSLSRPPLSSPCQSKASLLEKQPILLVLTFNAVVKKSPDGLGQPRLTWLKYHKATQLFTFKKNKPLKAIQRIEWYPLPQTTTPHPSSHDLLLLHLLSPHAPFSLSRSAPQSREGDFTLVTPDKAYVWRPSNPALRNSFICWCIDTARYSFNFAPPTNVDDRALSYLSSLLSFHYLHSPSASSVATASHRLILSSLDKPLVEEKKELNEAVVVPPLSASHQANILHFLQSSHLSVADIHQLEAALSASMLVQEQQSIEALYDSRQVQRTERLLAGIESVSEKLDELQMWLSHHDAELNRMRAGIERIEGKNTRLEVQEYNHQQLYNALRDIIAALTLPPDVIRTLEAPDFKSNMAGVMRAVQQLDAVLSLRLDPAIEDMASVQQQRAKYSVLKAQFAKEVKGALEAVFQQYGGVGVPASEANGAVLENNAVQHAEIGRFVGLAQYLSRLDPEAYVGLRPRYTAIFARQYEVKFKHFFQEVKKIVQPERHESSLLSFPDFPPGSQAPPMGPAHVPPSAVHQTATATSIRGRQNASAAFRNAISCIIPLISKEEAFLVSFFTTPSPTGGTASGPSPPGTPTSAGSAAGGAGGDRGSREDVRRMMAALFPHVNDHLSELSSIAFKSDPFYALEMEVAIDHLMAASQASYLQNVMMMLQSHVKMLFNRFIDEQIAQVSATTASPKKSGVLPPVLKFPSFILKCESVVRGTGSSAAATSYQKLSFALFKWLEGVAKSDEKYTDVCLIENFHYFHHTFTSLPQPIPALQLPVEKAAAGYGHHLQRYIAWQVEYEMKDIARFWSRLEEAQKQMGVEDIQHSRDLGKHELRVITRDRLSSKAMHKSLVEVYKRVRKHLPRNDDMVRRVWGKVGEYVVERMRWFEKSVAQSYREEKLAVSSAEVQDMINKITAQPPKVNDRD